jgi:type I restriction enzyme M protein
MNSVIGESLEECYARLLRHGLDRRGALEQLALLLSLKMPAHSGLPVAILAERWEELLQLSEQQQFIAYRSLFAELAQILPPEIAPLFRHAEASLDAAELATLLQEIDRLDWDSLADGETVLALETLLERQAAREGGLWWLAPPAVLVDSLIALAQPKLEETVFDPAAGAGAFLAAAEYYRQSVAQEEAQAAPAVGSLVGWVNHRLQERLTRLNLLLHGLLDVELQSSHAADWQADVAVGNLAAGSAAEGNGWPDLAIELRLLRQVCAALKPGGRAALLVSDEFLFDDETCAAARTQLLDSCNLHTLLRLPNGILHGRDIPVNALFFTSGQPTAALWVYDLRSQLATAGSGWRFAHSCLAPFVTVYGDEANGNAPRRETPEHPRWRCFPRAQLAEGGDSLDIFCLEDHQPGAAPPLDFEETRAWLDSELSEVEALLRFPAPGKKAK